MSWTDKIETGFTTFDYSFSLSISICYTFNDNDIIPLEQIWFKQKSWTSDHILFWKHLWQKCLNRKSFCLLVLLIFAFDTIWQNALINLWEIVSTEIMYNTVSFSVKCEGGVSDNFDTINVVKWVKQRCILSPFFSCFSQWFAICF